MFCTNSLGYSLFLSATYVQKCLKSPPRFSKNIGLLQIVGARRTTHFLKQIAALLQLHTWWLLRARKLKFCKH